MGLILPQKVDVVITSGMVKYYEEKGYNIPRYYNKKQNKMQFKMGTMMYISVLDLKRNSNQEVNVICDCCKNKLRMQYGNFNRYVRSNGSYYCTHCETKNKEYTEKIKVQKVSKKDRLISELISYINKNGYPTNKRKQFKKVNNLSSAKVYKNTLGGDIVDWIKICGFKLTEEEKFSMLLHSEKITYTKEEVIDIVMDMSKKLDRPLVYDDFRKPKIDNVGISYVTKYFGTFNNMKKELGLEIVQENMIDRSPSKSDFIKECDVICKYILNQGRTFSSTREIESNRLFLSYGCLDKASKKYFNLSFVNYMNNLGISFPKAGSGINYNFENGEHTTSQFEYMFSTYLRESGLKYNIDYLRDVKYETIDNNYYGTMNCDYVIKYNGNVIYVEIAGLIQDYKQWYYSGKQIISSKSKEKYRTKLYKKEQIFKRNNLIYFILFPCDITRNFCDSILENPTIELRKEIEQRFKNNIDWRIIQKTGELKYHDELGRDGQPIVDYGEAI